MSVWASQSVPKIDMDALQAFVQEWLAGNIKQPADGRDGENGADGKDGRDGRNVTADQVQEAVNLWLARNRESLRGPRGFAGDDGGDGQAPEYEWDGTSLRFRNPDGSWGEWVDLKGDPGRDGKDGQGGGSVGGIFEVRAGSGIAVDNTDPRRPIVTATGTAGAQWVTLDGVPHQLNFVSVGGDEFEMELLPL